MRELFPITKELIYVNHAGTGPMSIPARKAIEECAETYSRQAEFTLADYVSRLEAARTAVARLIGAQPEEITFTHSTSEGIYIALINVPLQEGDEILVMDEVFPAARYVVDYNVPHLKKKYISFAGRDIVQVVKENLTKRVRVVIIDFVQFLSGEMFDIKTLSHFLRENNIYFIVDGIQAIGAVEFNVRETEVDFFACGAAKWLFGPSGTGFLYINRRNFKQIKRFHTGWLGAEWQSFERFEAFPPLFEDARMFEQGTRNVMGISAFCENIKILLDYGLNNVSAQIQSLKEELRRIFKELGYEITTPEQGLQSGIITVRPKGDAKIIFEKLADKSVTISLRNNCLRFSPHFYNTLEEVEQIFGILKH